MGIPTGPPLLIALGIRLFLNALNPAHTPSTPDHLLLGVWQGVLLHYVLRHIQPLLFPTGFAIVGKLLYDFSLEHDTTRLACILLGAALGVLGADVISQLFEDGRYDEKERNRSSRRPRRDSVRTELDTQVTYEPSSRRLRLVSFGRSTAVGSVEPSRLPTTSDAHHRTRSASHAELLRSTSPASHITNTNDTLASLSSSLAEASASPAERAIAVLRARASLADSERRRFKEERKWALSQGNVARAEQLGWQVKRYAELMKSFNREADARLLDADRAKHAQNQLTSPAMIPTQATPMPVPIPMPTLPSTSTSLPFPSAPPPGQPQAQFQHHPQTQAQVPLPFPTGAGTGTGTRHATITHHPPLPSSSSYPVPIPAPGQPQGSAHYIPSANPAVAALGLHTDPSYPQTQGQTQQYTIPPQQAQAQQGPLVSVTVAGGGGTRGAGGKPRARKRSGGTGVLKPAIYVHQRESSMTRR